ncbi:MAG: NAD(P)/FAD-dependent oxidoreductase [Deltaproteobacteria bacterium]|nr:NAD(P)/FAD-dependent oxidoreductase [Candidatus Zymogenaceae bacterium]
MDQSYDVIVIGSGFGGPVAARKCAESGLKTLMIERSEHVGEKVVSGLTIPVYGFLFGPAFIRDGNPPIERPVDGIINYIVKDIDTGDIEIDDSLMVPKPFSPITAFGYNAYCMPFCEWEARKAVESGVVLLTSTTVTDLIREDGIVKGVVIEGGTPIRSKIVIDAEGSQGLVAVKAGVREKYPPETISLADTYDYEMPKDKIDELLGYSIRFCWGWDEQRIAPPLGHGNGLMVWPYRESLHFMQDQCLRQGGKRVVNLRKAFDEYHTRITSKLPWWTDEVEPHVTLRARMWEGFEIFVGLDDKLRAMPNHTDGMILIGDAAGLESTELCDGVPAAWFSAEIAADVAISAVRKGDTSGKFLARYDRRIRKHPIIQWSIRATNRYNLRKAQQSHDEDELKRYIHQGWGLGALGEISTPLLRTLLISVVKDPRVITSWIAMFFRYYHNWHHNRFEYGNEKNKAPETGEKKNGGKQRVFTVLLRSIDLLLLFFGPIVRLLALLLVPLAWLANSSLRLALPLIEPLYIKVTKMAGPTAGRLSERLIAFTVNSDPSIFSLQSNKDRG